MRFQLQTGLFLLMVASATIAEAQVAPVPEQFQQRMHRPRPSLPENGSSPAPGLQPTAPIAPQQAAVAPLTTPPSATPPPVAPLTASSLLDQPAKPAQIHVDAGQLSVKADNSTLSDILHDISSQTGMTVDGLSRDLRIFGSYGPANPREVLSALLDGAGYNVMMVGSLDNGAPRQLMLTPRTGGGAAPGQGPGSGGGRQMQGVRQNAGDDDDDSTPDQQQDAQPPRPEPNPPETAPQPDQTPPAGQPGQIKTPQQMLQELQQIRQQQMQQQQPANPQ
jgi:hypothetical protein